MDLDLDLDLKLGFVRFCGSSLQLHYWVESIQE